VVAGTDKKPPVVLGTVGDSDKVQRTSVTVRVPATTANMGPGFDTIGMCLDMWSEFTVSLAETFELTNEGDGKTNAPPCFFVEPFLLLNTPRICESSSLLHRSCRCCALMCKPLGADDCPTDETNLVCVGLHKAYGLAGKAVPPLKYKCVNRIPYARGLGSSSAAIVGGIIAGLMLSGHRLSCWGAEELLQIACDIEGHPDNVAPVREHRQHW
jgi:homoserine kinase